MAFPKLFQRLFSNSGAGTENITSTYATKTEDAAKLPLAGGRMTGSIISSPSNGQAMASPTTSSGVCIYGGTNYTNGAYVNLRGKDSTDPYTTPGSFELSVNDGTNSRQLVGLPNGHLRWGGIEHTAWGMPKQPGTAVTAPASGGSITATGDGWITFGFQNIANANSFVRLSCGGGYWGGSFFINNNAQKTCVVSVPVKAGDGVSFYYENVSTLNGYFCAGAGTP